MEPDLMHIHTYKARFCRILFITTHCLGGFSCRNNEVLGNYWYTISKGNVNFHPPAPIKPHVHVLLHIYSVKIDLAGVGGEGRTRARDGGGEMGSMTKKEKKIWWPVSAPASLWTSTAGISASLMLDFRDKEETNNIHLPGTSLLVPGVHVHGRWGRLWLRLSTNSHVIGAQVIVTPCSSEWPVSVA